MINPIPHTEMITEDSKSVSAITAQGTDKNQLVEIVQFQPDASKDLRGLKCPMNFVKTKIALSPLQSGQILEIQLDDGPPINNVPGSLQSQGHTILQQEQREDSSWKVLIRKA